MEQLLSYLPFLACPVGMGLMMWFMMRGNQSEHMGSTQTPAEAPVAKPIALDAITHNVSTGATAEERASTGAARAEDLVPQAGATATRTIITIAGMCIDVRVVGGLAAAGLALFVVAPNLVLGALPYLLLAACPLSMLFMMQGRMNMGGKAAHPAGTGHYSCPMHPEVRSDQPGRCPRCGMALTPTAQPRQVGEPQTEATGAVLTREEQLGQLQMQLEKVNEQQAALARQIEQMQASEATPAAREAPAVGRAADKRAQAHS